MEELNSFLQAGKLVLVVDEDAFPSRNTCEEIINTVYLPIADFKDLQPHNQAASLLLLSPSGKVLFTTKELPVMVDELARLSQIVKRAMQRPKTKLAVSFQNGRSTKVLEFDPATTRLSTVLEAFECDTLVMKFPKREFSLVEHGDDKTLLELDLVGAVALLALWNWIFRAAAAATPTPAPVAEPIKKRKKNNEYWNGDSTVFEAPPDKDDE